MMAMKHIAMTTTPAAPALATTGMSGKEVEGSIEGSVEGSVEGEGAEVVGGGSAAEKERGYLQADFIKIPTILTYIFAVVLG